MLRCVALFSFWAVGTDEKTAVRWSYDFVEEGGM
jgi:hypothetical protein